MALTHMSSPRGLGYRPDERDDGRDFLLQHAIATWERREAPGSAMSFEALVPRIFDQGPIGSCVPAAGYAAMSLRARILGRELPMGAVLWGYYLARDAAGVAKFDVGSRIRDFWRCTNHYGFLAEADYKYGYDASKWYKRPPPLSFRRAIDHKLIEPETGKGQYVSYFRIYGDSSEVPAMIVDALAHGRPVVFGTNVSRDFVAGSFDADRVWTPPVGEIVAGGHAMYVVGHDPARDAFRVISSWGAAWGENGACWMSSSYFSWSSTSDIWVVDRVPEYKGAS